MKTLPLREFPALASVCAAGRTCIRAGLLAALALAAATAPLAAQTVSYVRDLTFPPEWSGTIPVLPMVQSPIDTSDPLYNPALPDMQWIITAAESIYNFDPTTGIVSSLQFLPGNIKVAPDSLATLTGVGTSTPTLEILGRRNTLYVLDIRNWLTKDSLSGVSVPLGIVYSLAAYGNNLTAMADAAVLADDGLSFIQFSIGYSITTATGAVTPVFGTSGNGSAPGQFNAAYYHTYGPNGLLYVLDYGNDRVQMLDPKNAFAPVGQFTLQSGVTTANMQFAIGPTGNVYLGDGLGGGSSYAADGTYLGTFILPDTVTGDPFVGTPYLSTDATGDVFVFDTTGFHQYQDSSAVPEPPTYALAFSALLGAVLMRRRQPSISRRA